MTDLAEPRPPAPATTIDSHAHVWYPQRREGFAEKWLSAPGWEPIRREIPIEELEDTLKRSGVQQVLLVHATGEIEENAELLALAADHGVVAGVVGWVPLSEPKRAVALIEEYVPNPAFRGVRYMAGWEPLPAAEDLVSTLRPLLEARLALEVMPSAVADLDRVDQIAGLLPELPVVIDHLAKPLTAPSRDEWDRQMTKVAAHPSTYTKVSGWTTPVRQGWSSEDLRSYVERAAELFGPERLMFASNWPVALLAGSYEATRRETVEALRGCSPTELRSILSGAARTAYGLG